jgi:hypothetical protein
VLRGEHRQTAPTRPIGVEQFELMYPPAPPKRGARHPVAGATTGMVGQFTGNVPLTITCHADSDATAQEDDRMSTPGYGASAELSSHCVRVYAVNRLLPKQVRQWAVPRFKVNLQPVCRAPCSVAILIG